MPSSPQGQPGTPPTLPSGPAAYPPTPSAASNARPRSGSIGARIANCASRLRRSMTPTQDLQVERIQVRSAEQADSEEGDGKEAAGDQETAKRSLLAGEGEEAGPLAPQRSRSRSLSRVVSMAASGVERFRRVVTPTRRQRSSSREPTIGIDGDFERPTSATSSTRSPGKPPLPAAAGSLAETAVVVESPFQVPDPSAATVVAAAGSHQQRSPAARDPTGMAFDVSFGSGAGKPRAMPKALQERLVARHSKKQEEGQQESQAAQHPTQELAAPAAREQQPEGPQGGIKVELDFGANAGPAKRMPPGLAKRMAERASKSRVQGEDTAAAPAAEGTCNGSHTSAEAAPKESSAEAPRGGVALEFDFGGPPKRAAPPSALHARLSRTRGSAKQPEHEHAPADEEDMAAADGPFPRRRTKRVLDADRFLADFPQPAPHSESPAEVLADHDSMELQESISGHALTTQAIRALCKNLKALSPPSVRKLLEWRAALRYERRTGQLPSETELKALMDEEAVAAAQLLGVVGPATAAPSGEASKAAPPATVEEQAKGLAQAMKNAVEERAGDEDKELLDRIEQEIKELNEALKKPGISAQEAFLVRKQLGQRRSEKARAERAIRKGRKAALEVKGGHEAVQAILQSVSDAAPTLKSAQELKTVVPWADEPADLPSSMHQREWKKQLPPGFGQEPPAAAVDLALAVMLHPDTLMAAGCRAIGRVAMVCKAFKDVALDANDPSFGDTAWRCACKALAGEQALYCSEPVLDDIAKEPRGACGLSDTATALNKKESRQGFWKKLFFEQLYPARLKWQEGADEGVAPRRVGELGVSEAAVDVTRDFKIQVSVRFKPGEQTQSKLLVPLHQKLALLRKGGQTDAFANIGLKEPPEFLDALLGHIMTDPVKLPSSGKICDRRVVEEQVKKNGRDPFDGSPLDLAQLQPQDELRSRISVWKMGKRKNATDRGEEHKLDEDEVQKLVKEFGADLDPEVVEMLMEAERLKAVGSRALREANADKKRKQDNEGDELENADDEGAWWAESEPGQAIANAAVAGGAAAMPVAGARHLDRRGIEATEEELGDAPKREGPRLLAVMPPTRAIMFQPGAGIRPFIFGRVFDGEASQEEVYEYAARGSVCAALNGFNACMLVYGQTGSGKTHTMFGQSVACGGNAGAVVSRGSGTVVRAMRELFAAAEDLQRISDVTTTLSAQYVQVYQDQVTCLCTGNAVSLREAVAGAPVLLQGAQDTELHNLGDTSQLLMKGEERKRYAETAMNHHSSRAHTILAVKISQRRGDLTVSSQLHLVDLAGSERVKKSKAQGGRLVEAVGINSSLMVLGQCIAARVEERSHVPYYESKLTLLLRSALGGNSRTTAVICCHKEDLHGDETLQALSFGERCARISNKAHAAMASSSSAAVAAIDAALAECSTRMEGLAARGKNHLPSFGKLQKQHEMLTRRRTELARSGGA
eukprot:TRINITY_DN17754_c0_g1_i1.p1 TRINITY_DN17754_c0_g1~~TRINITY_DN17754_c0_g1_i1.p1  ORF type:complete len:1453 (-),score=381.56 TRINITY_DN17754_c0_g1_i1:218-4576(-)